MYIHWHRLARNIGANQNILSGEKWAITDESTGASQLLQGHMPGLPPKSTPTCTYIELLICPQPTCCGVLFPSSLAIFAHRRDSNLSDGCLSSSASNCFCSSADHGRLNVPPE